LFPCFFSLADDTKKYHVFLSVLLRQLAYSLAFNFVAFFEHIFSPKKFLMAGGGSRPPAYRCSGYAAGLYQVPPATSRGVCINNAPLTDAGIAGDFP
jgi:hypothetical protein